MSKQVIIYDEVDTETELAELLREVARLIDQGMTSGHYPGWEIVENE